MVKICSFDVGIKNLAYCIITKHEDDKNIPFTINKWGVINFDSANITCEHTLQNKNTLCTKNANFALTLPDEKPSFCCSSHKKHLNERLNIFSENNNILNTKEKQKCIHIMKTGKMCDKTAHYVNNKCCLCKVHLKSNTSIKKLKTLACHKKPIEDICTNLINILEDEYLFLSDVDEVLIENQPININGTTVGTMKSVACFIMSYFTMKGKQNNKIKNIKFISPSNKLSIDKEQTDVKLKEGDNKKEVYDLTKELGIEYTRLIIEHYKLHDEKKIWESFKDKQDDLCDAFLQGFHYLFFKENLSKFSCIGDVKNNINIDVMKKILREGSKNIMDKKENKIKHKEECAIKKAAENVAKNERKKQRAEKATIRAAEKVAKDEHKKDKKIMHVDDEFNDDKQIVVKVTKRKKFISKIC